MSKAEIGAGEDSCCRIRRHIASHDVIDVATMAALGIGFFSWNSQVDAKANLAELTAYREANGAEGKKKACALPNF